MSINKVLLVVLTSSPLILTACGGGSSTGPGAPSGGGDPSPPSNPSPSPTVDPSPEPSQSPSPSCKVLHSVWSTTDIVPSALLGLYIGPPTNGPVFTLDLRVLRENDSLSEFKVDADRTCYYVTLPQTNGYILANFATCFPKINEGSPDECNYCPDTGIINHSYTYNLSCSALTITDDLSGITYHYK